MNSHILSLALSNIFVFPLTRFSLHVDGLCLRELQSSDPSLALYFGVGLQVVGLRPSVGNDKIAVVLHCNIGCGQVDGASACVTHLCLGPEDETEWSQEYQLWSFQTPVWWSKCFFCKAIVYFLKIASTVGYCLWNSKVNNLRDGWYLPPPLGTTLAFCWARTKPSKFITYHYKVRHIHVTYL